jgi:hypothetical protein
MEMTLARRASEGNLKETRICPHFFRKRASAKARWDSFEEAIPPAFDPGLKKSQKFDFSLSTIRSAELSRHSLL